MLLNSAILHILNTLKSPLLSKFYPKNWHNHKFKRPAQSHQFDEDIYEPIDSRMDSSSTHRRYGNPPLVHALSITSGTSRSTMCLDCLDHPPCACPYQLHPSCIYPSRRATHGTPQVVHVQFYPLSLMRPAYPSSARRSRWHLAS
jgi:hypothetical protein